jgi:glucan endo-1,3-alpha-glucosidase
MNWVEYSDFLWTYRWNQAIQDVNPDIIEIGMFPYLLFTYQEAQPTPVTWNDYAESHYIGDINPNVVLDPDAQQYVLGMVHSPWRIPAQHFIQWWKTGSEQPITVCPFTNENLPVST